MGNNKIIFGNTVLIDLTADTVTENVILAGYTAHDASGNIIVGKCTFDVDSSDATVQVAEMLDGKTAYARGTKMVGTMPNRGGVSLSISMVNEEVSIPQGYHDGSGKVGILDVEKAKLIAGNIKKGITILGVEGTLEPSSSVVVQAKIVTPGVTQQSVVPDEGYDYLAEVTVEAIPYVETENAAGGITVTIGV